MDAESSRRRWIECGAGALVRGAGRVLQTSAKSQWPVGHYSVFFADPSVRTGTPPVTGICITRDAPDRGNPVTTIISRQLDNADMETGERFKCSGQLSNQFAITQRMMGRLGDLRAAT